MESQQHKLIINIKKFFLSFNNNNYLPYKNSIFHLASASEGIGRYLLNVLSKKKDQNFFKNFSIIFNIFNDVVYSLNYVNHKLYYSNTNFYYDKIVVTWAFENDFDKNGSFDDRYFNVNSKKLKKTLWFVIYLSKNIPKNVNNNIVLFKPITKKSFNVFNIISNSTKHISFLPKSFKYYLATISNVNYFAEIFLKQINPFLNSKVRFILMPFEGQPFQNRLIHFVKKKFLSIKTIGYIHAPPIGMPSQYIYKNSSPHKIILNGKDQLYCFTKILGWKKKQIKLLPSYRFIKYNFKFKNTIFLPLSVRNIQKILNSINFLNSKNYIDIKKFTIKKHPAALDSKKNIYFEKKMKILIKNSKKKNYQKKNCSIFIGSSGAIIEALERGANVIQISDFPLLDMYSSKLWPSIIVKKIGNNTFSYELKRRGNLIKLGNKKKNLNKIFN
jgi:hypothetical protein